MHYGGGAQGSRGEHDRARRRVEGRAGGLGGAGSGTLYGEKGGSREHGS